jgi:hypothetical protein
MAGVQGVHTVYIIQDGPVIFTVARRLHVQKYVLSLLGPDSERHSISDRNVHTGPLLIAQIHGYLMGLKSIKTLIVGLQKI